MFSSSPANWMFLLLANTADIALPRLKPFVFSYALAIDSAAKPAITGNTNSFKKCLVLFIYFLFETKVTSAKS